MRGAFARVWFRDANAIYWFVRSFVAFRAQASSSRQQQQRRRRWGGERGPGLGCLPLGKRDGRCFWPLDGLDVPKARHGDGDGVVGEPGKGWASTGFTRFCCEASSPKFVISI